MYVQAVMAVSVASTVGVWLGYHESGTSLFEQMVAQTVESVSWTFLSSAVGYSFRWRIL